MVRTELKNIFLSASIPLPERNQKYCVTADIIAIRDAIIALATTALPTCRLVWGGHPSITPLINNVMARLKLEIQDHMIIYQSKFFEDKFPSDNNKFKNIVQISSKDNKESSLKFMREEMLKAYDFSAGVFIGGMEGVEDEYEMFIKLCPNASILPVASTGAASRIIYEKLPANLKNKRLKNDYAYTSLFQDLLVDNLCHESIRL